MAGMVLKDLMLLHIFTTKANHPQALMKKKPAILFLLPVLLLLLSGSGLKAGAADRATTALLTYTLLADRNLCIYITTDAINFV